jgi:raffinose/stachyose/melibiose transport system permease protein
MNTKRKTDLSPRGVRRKAITRKPIHWGAIASYAIMILLAAVYIGPLLILVNTSLKTQSTFLRDATALATSFNVKNYIDAWNKANFPKYLVNSLFYMVTATAIYIITAVFVAFPIARNYVKGHKFLFTLFIIALFLPTGLIPLFQLILHLGLYNTQVGYILLFLVNPIGVVILVNFIKSIPRELDEAAALDGCGYLQFVLQIIFPLITPAVATVAVLHAIGIWNELVLPTIYLTNQKYYPITRGLIVFRGVYGNNWPALAAATLILMVPMLILYVFLQRYIIFGLTQGSVKG